MAPARHPANQARQVQRRSCELLARAVYKLCLIQVAVEHGLCVVDLPARRRSNAPLHQVERLAIYLAVTVFDLPRRSVAKAARVGRSSACRSCHEVEDLREDLATDAMIERLGAQLGPPA